MLRGTSQRSVPAAPREEPRALLRVLLIDPAGPRGGGGGAAAAGGSRVAAAAAGTRDGGEYLGFVEVGATTTLAALRGIIASTLDAQVVPAHYSFLDGRGAFIGSVHEAGALARRFLPAVSLMRTSESPLAARAVVTLWSGALVEMWVLSSATFRVRV